MSELVFRTATLADVPALVALVESAYRGDASRQGWTTEADLLGGQRIDSASLSETMSKPDSVVMIAERDQQMLGCAHLERQGTSAYFGMFAVVPTLQGGGVGATILERCERYVRETWHCSAIRMSVIWSRSELIAWYTRRGYAPTGERKPFPYGDARFGEPKRADLYFEVYAKAL